MDPKRKLRVLLQRVDQKRPAPVKQEESGLPLQQVVLVGIHGVDSFIRSPLLCSCFTKVLGRETLINVYLFYLFYFSPRSAASLSRERRGRQISLQWTTPSPLQLWGSLSSSTRLCKTTWKQDNREEALRWWRGPTP